MNYFCVDTYGLFISSLRNCPHVVSALVLLWLIIDILIHCVFVNKMANREWTIVRITGNKKQKQQNKQTSVSGSSFLSDIHRVTHKSIYTFLNNVIMIKIMVNILQTYVTLAYLGHPI